ncbi:hypothetical protein Salat_1461300 [Sesamum alatum]|uniref:Uncharacterized protein n=1 Tax=Sesamum alatum TaxID=300844 RepID=A0AAE1YB23_9LAMI|nr:hypothetical protein Salat_1461300 [Sesamum alatum]
MNRPIVAGFACRKLEMAESAEDTSIAATITFASFASWSGQRSSLNVPYASAVSPLSAALPSRPSSPLSASFMSLFATRFIITLEMQQLALQIHIQKLNVVCVTDCTLLRDEHLESETNTDSRVQVSFDAPAKISSAKEHVSVFDIVRETCGHAALQSPRSTSSDPDNSPRPSSNNVGTSMINSIDGPISTSLEIVMQHPTKPNARTLRRCRNLHNRIRVLRQNWDGFRSGILHFSSSAGDDDISSKKSTSASCVKLQSTAQCSSSVITNDIEAHEIDRAWKMLDKAKSIRQGRGRPSIVHQASKCPTRKPNTLGHADCTRHSPDSQQNRSKNVGTVGLSQHSHYSLEKAYYTKPSSGSGKQKWSWHTTEDVTKLFSEGSLTGLSATNQELESSKGAQTPSYTCTASLRSGEKLPAEKSFKEPACLSSSVMSESVVVNVDVKGVNHTSSSCTKVKNPKEKSKLEQICVASQLYSDAKSEIQSLVKLNLKLQTKAEKLEVDAFKEVARLATHSILAACGLEHPKAGSSSIPEETDAEKNMITS